MAVSPALASNFDQAAGARMCSSGGSRGIAISGSSAASPSIIALGALFAFVACFEWRVAYFGSTLAGTGLFPTSVAKFDFGSGPVLNEAE